LGIDPDVQDHREVTTLTPGTVLQNRYRIVSLLPGGGMARVYKA